MSKVGISNLHYAVMDASHQDSATANPQYGTIKAPTCGIVSANIQANSNTAKLFADNILWESETSMQDGTLDLDVADLPLEVQADLLGHTYDSTGKTLIKKSSDTAPYVAVGGEFLMANGKKLAFWLYKVKFQEPSQSGNTKGDNTEFQTNAIQGTFSALKGGGDNVGRWQYSQEFGSTDATTTFYTSVPLAAVSP